MALPTLIDSRVRPTRDASRNHRTVAYRIRRVKMVNLELPFNTLRGYVILVILNSYARDVRSYAATMSVNLFLTMYMGFSNRGNTDS